MNKRNSLLQFIISSRRKSESDSEFAKEIACVEKYSEVTIVGAMEEIFSLVRYWSEGMDLASVDTKKPTKYFNIFELLFENKSGLTYKEVAQEVGGANIKKFVYKCNKIAIAKARKMSKNNVMYKQIIEMYFVWVNNFFLD